MVSSGLNPFDTKNRGGWGGYRDMPYPRIIPHNDGAGVIQAHDTLDAHEVVGNIVIDVAGGRKRVKALLVLE